MGELLADGSLLPGTRRGGRKVQGGEGMFHRMWKVEMQILRSPPPNLPQRANRSFGAPGTFRAPFTQNDTPIGEEIHLLTDRLLAFLEDYDVLQRQGLHSAHAHQPDYIHLLLQLFH
jgi:hypothetical protein